MCGKVADIPVWPEPPSWLPDGGNGLDRYVGCHCDLIFNSPDIGAWRKYNQPVG
jgi:hypothetical protein